MSRAQHWLCAALLAALSLAGAFGGLAHALKVPTSRVTQPDHAYAAGPYTVRGNTILDAQGRPYAFHGVARDGLEFSCRGDAYLTLPYLALLGPPVPGVSGTFWYSNTVRLPLSEAFWLHGQPQQHCTSTSYQILVRKTIDTLLLLHLNVIIDLQWTDAGGQSTGGTWQMPDEDSVLFWQQMARLYGNYPAVLFELYNEPHPYPSTGDPWGCWRAGCQVVHDDSNDFYCGCRLSFDYRAVGMQTLVDTIRQAGANNLILAGGLNWGYDLSKLPLYALSGANIVYDTHPYPYQGKLTLSDWQAGFGQISATYPVMSAESGEYDCKAAFLQRLVPYLDAHHISWIGWAWYAQGSPCSFPQLVSDYYGTPEPAMGMYIYQTLVRYAGVAPQTTFTILRPGTGPVNAQWYFAGEPVGEGFSQVLLLDNASAQDCAVTVRYLLQPARGSQGPVTTKTVSFRIGALERVAAQVNSDLGIPVVAPGMLVAALVRVDNGATPACPGIVAERAVHLNNGKLLGGSALLGVTKASPTFFFADVPTGKNNAVVSALSALNPGPRAATVTVRYFAAGRQVGMQQSVLPALSEEQIRPPANLPGHVAAVLIADQPVVAMRATLLSNLAVRGIGAISGFSEVAGSAQSARAWFFAEGSTGPGFQENLALANPGGSGAAHLTITLDYANGKSSVFHATVAASDQIIWDVNAHSLSVGDATPEVAVEITSDLPVVAERVMLFRYQLASGPITGLTDVPGTLQADASTISTFADGYSAPGFDEWLSLQNITGRRELLTLTFVHAGHYLSYQCYLPPHGRGTISVNRLLQMLGQGVAQGYGASLIVQADGAFVAERPMYWNMAGSQGGSDVGGYPGN